MSPSKQYPFFVYGTLLPDQPNFYLWGSAITSMETAQFNGGQLYDMGFYPMVVAAKVTAVQGMVIWVAAARYTIIQQRLDNLEGYDPANADGSAYRRQRVQVTLANGRLQQAWIYMGQPQFAGDKPVISSGNWASYAAQKRTQSEAWWHTVNSVAGLHK